MFNSWSFKDNVYQGICNHIISLSNYSDVSKTSSNEDEHHVGIDNKRQSSAMDL